MPQGDSWFKTKCRMKPLAIAPHEKRVGTTLSYITPRAAAAEAEVTTMTIRTWCQKYGVGKRVGGRWRIDPERFRKVLDGVPLDKIEDHGERHP